MMHGGLFFYVPVPSSLSPFLFWEGTMNGLDIFPSFFFSPSLEPGRMETGPSLPVVFLSLPVLGLSLSSQPGRAK